MSWTSGSIDGRRWYVQALSAATKAALQIPCFSNPQAETLVWSYTLEGTVVHDLNP
jgi:hypothetical protein